MMAPIAMLNALWFRPNGGRESYSRYSEGVLPLIQEVGADVLFPPLPLERALEGEFDPDLFFIVRYPSAESFDRMWESEEYAEVARHRTDALVRVALTRCAIDPVDAGPAELHPGIALLNILWFESGGRERYDDYLEAVQPLVEGVGGRLTSPRFIPEKVVEGDLLPDLVLIGNYPSMDALVEMATSAAYEHVATIRAEAVTKSFTTSLLVT
jgi:uncharacterized protein (DUF1330 family)